MNDNEFAELKRKLEESLQTKAGQCPTCGRCPACGRGANPWPRYPSWPSYPNAPWDTKLPPPIVYLSSGTGAQ